LSRLVGLYPDVLADTIAYFEPMIRMDPSINTRDLIPQFNEYVAEPMKPVDPNKPKAPRVDKRVLAQYSSIADFVYKKMTNVGGLVDTSMELSDEDLAVLEKLVSNEVARRRKNTRKK